MRYKRFLLKLSGEAISGKDTGGSILDFSFLGTVSKVIKKCVDNGAEIAVIVGAGNIWRGRQGTNMSAAKADHMGMLATTINAIAVQDSLVSAGLESRVLTSVEMKQFAECYTYSYANELLSKGTVVVLGGGLGLPYFSTDTAAVHRAIDINADAALFAKNIDCVYSADPSKDPSAKRIARIGFEQMIEMDLRAIDATASILAQERHLPILVFGLNDPDNIYRACTGEDIGTLISNENKLIYRE